MDWKAVKSITINCYDLQAILLRQTNNPLAEEEWIQNFHEAIEAGVKVIVTDPLGSQGRLMLQDQRLIIRAI